MVGPALSQRAPALPTVSAVVELYKPITWFAPMWAFGCGVVSAPVPVLDSLPALAGGVLLAGPLVCGTSQAVNDWYDRHVDAINEPHRVIPSGRMPGDWAFRLAIVTSVIALAFATLLGSWVVGATALGLVLAWAYSAPPARLKTNGWIGNAAVGLCYEGLPWFTAAAAVSGGFPGWPVVVMAFAYSVGAHGIMTLNDFKSVSGDLRMGIRSLPAQLGTDRAARLACVVMAVPQVVVIGLLVAWGFPLHGLAVAALLVAQGLLMVRLLADPLGRAAWYNATGTTLYVLGMLVAAFALRAMGGA
jgi:chlorophyll synthase